MKTIETKHFEFLTFDHNNKKQMESVYLMQDDPTMRQYFGDMVKYFDEIDFGLEDLSGHYMTFLNDQIVGFVSMYDYASFGTIDYGIIKDYRGLKISSNDTIATMMTKEFTEEVFKKHVELQYFRAYINRYNIRSVQMAKKAGFIFYKNNEPLLHDEYHKYRNI